jgi:acyl-CoA thioester hydrolase
MTSSHHEADAGWFDGRVHHRLVRVYYEDTDLSGLVYHANYLRYFERGRSDFLRLAGISHTGLLTRDPPLAFAVTGIDIRYRKAARIDDSLDVATSYDAISGARLMISQSIRRGDDLVTTAAVEAVCIDLAGRPRRPFPELAAALQPWLAPERP